MTGWQQDMACGRVMVTYLMAAMLFCASFRTESGSGAEPAFFAATAWPSVLSTNPRYALVSVPWAASLWTVQVIDVAEQRDGVRRLVGDLRVVDDLGHVAVTLRRCVVAAAANAAVAPAAVYATKSLPVPTWIVAWASESTELWSA